MKKLKLAIIGCGAMTEEVYLPCISQCEHFDLGVLVEKDLSRAQRLADQYHVNEVVDDYRKIVGKADAAIVVLPHHLHAPVTIDLEKNGIHTLVEKPMALTVSDCDTMIKTADEERLVLAVGLIRRFYKTSNIVKQILESGILGNIKEFDFREGAVYGWNVVSDFPFRKETGGGVLADTGVHVLDLMLWWLGDYKQIRYYDDAMGGVEADCLLELEMVNGANGIVELSRTRTMRNTLIISGDCAELEVGTSFNPRLELQLKLRDIRFSCTDLNSKENTETFHDIVMRQIIDFYQAISNHRKPFISGIEGRRTVELIQYCYDHRQPLYQSWFLPEAIAHLGAL